MKDVIVFWGSLIVGLIVGGSIALSVTLLTAVIIAIGNQAFIPGVAFGILWIGWSWFCYEPVSSILLAIMRGESLF